METIKHKSESDSGQGDSRWPKTGRGVSHAPMSDARRRLARLAEAQHVPVVRNVADLAVDFWPEDESADDVNTYIYRQRHDDRLRA